MTNEDLISALKAQNLIADEQASSLKREATASGRSLEDVIHERRIVSDEKVAEAKSKALNIPYRKISLDDMSADLLELIPEETVRNYGIVPIEKRDNMLVAGMLNPDDEKAQEALRFVARSAHLDLGIYIISYGDWRAVLKKYSPYRSEIEAAVKSLDLKPKAGKMVSLDAEGAGDEAPIIRIVSDTLEEAVASGASDVHIEPQKNYLRVRFRIGGDLKETASLPPELSQPVISRVKVMSNLRIDETRVPQDGRFRARLLDREIDFRISTFPTPLGEKVAIRVLDPETGLKSLDELGLMGHNLESVKKGIENPYGMVLITGPTGSGKSTTLYALLQLLNNEKVNIVSLEDPVEYFVSGVNQSQVRPEIKYDFASGLRQILRQDPDIIMVGEIRDNETAGLAIHAALTGHVVLSTLHTNNAVGVVPRLIDMNVDGFLIPEAVNLMISQRLIPKLCEACKQAEPASEGIQSIITQALEHLPEQERNQYKSPYQIYHSEGCPQCGGRGVSGRIAIFEVLAMTKELAHIVSQDPTLEKIEEEARRQGMVTLREDGILKALKGIVPIEEVLRETSEY